MPVCSLIERSLYPYFFSTDEEAGIVGRLRRRERPAPPRRGRGSSMRAMEARA